MLNGLKSALDVGEAREHVGPVALPDHRALG
ncbi:MAG: hypothetical protein ACODAG_01550 [Myxococcota bacterium]